MSAVLSEAGGLFVSYAIVQVVLLGSKHFLDVSLAQVRNVVFGAGPFLRLLWWKAAGCLEPRMFARDFTAQGEVPYVK